MKHRTIIVTISLFVTLQISAQVQETIKDFFVPANGKNKAILHSPLQSGNVNMIKNIFYINKDGYFDILIGTFLNDQNTAIQTMSVQFTKTEVKMIRSASTTMFETNKKKIYNPPSLILKMPSEGLTAIWTVTEISGDVEKCISSWTAVTINEEKIKALKVIKSNDVFSSKEIDYYVKGIGLWKIDILSEGETQTQFEFDKLETETEGRN